MGFSDLLKHIFLYNEDPTTPGLSQDLFFTKIYFWLFLAFILFIYWLIYEVKDNIVKAITFGIGIVSFFILTIYQHELLPMYIWWGGFSFMLIFYSIKDKNQAIRNTFLFAASLFFYYKSSGLFFVILLFSTLIDYIIGQGIYQAKEKNIRKFLVVLSITINLLVLALFKYAYFFSDSFKVFLDTLNSAFGYDFYTQWNFNEVLEKWSSENLGKGFTFSKIILPVGVSFFTFQTISYSVDIYRGQLKPVKNILDFGFYVSFFPQLVMGPIVRASDFIPQMYKPYSLSKYQFGLGLFWILNGLLKKAFLADFIANGFIDYSFQNPDMSTGFQCMMAIFGYSLQVYADFSGYTDMAIGIALLMGFTLNQNFNSPYKAKNVGDFWKRWHISLSTWLRDYLYIPIGGNRKGTFASYLILTIMVIIMALLSPNNWHIILISASIITLSLLIASKFFNGTQKWINTNINLMITMLLGGLWHGSNWNMVIWGGLNGLGLIIYKFWRKVSPYEKINNWWSNSLKIIITLTFISFTRIFFRSDNMETASTFLSRITLDFKAPLILEVITEFWFYYLIMILGYGIHLIPQDYKIKYRHWFIRQPIYFKGIILVLSVVLAYQSLQASQPFIYFSF